MISDEVARQIAGSLAAHLEVERRRGAPGLDRALSERAVQALASLTAATPGQQEQRSAAPTPGHPQPAPAAARPSEALRNNAQATPPSRTRAAKPPAAPPPRSGERPIWATSSPGAAKKGCGSPALKAIRDELGDCQRCHLSNRRKNIVFGVGNPNARLMFIGEAPGADEDRQAEPFVGKAGQLLTKMIGAMGFARSDVYIANILKCRPPANRDPQPDEVAACRPFLDKQIAAVDPEVIVTLGKVAPNALFERDVRITRERGTWTEYNGVPVMLTLHPAYLLRQPAAKRDAWADLQAVMKRLGIGKPS